MREMNPNSFKEKLDQFLHPTAVAVNNIKPTIIRHYANTYKLVDNYNALLAILKWPYRSDKVELVWLINSLLMVVVNTWVIWNDMKLVNSIESDEDSLKQFVKKLCDELLLE